MNKKRFDFGQNWSNYSKNIGYKELGVAIKDLKKLLPANYDPKNKSFIDIGCGSGIHSIAASKIGFKKIISTDYDKKSINTTSQNIKIFKVEKTITVLEDDILNTNIDKKFDVVYSWGVLHHTGNMSKAIDISSSLVNDQGLYIIAIYKKTKFCKIWKFIKKIYNSNIIIKYFLTLIYVPIITLLFLIKYKKTNVNRGMKVFYDAIDWLGGYPYESATSNNIIQSLKGYNLIKIINDEPPFLFGIFGSGCAEYVFTKKD